MHSRFSSGKTPDVGNMKILNSRTKQESIPVGCVPIASVPPLDVSTTGGGGPQVNKCEQVSSDDPPDVTSMGVGMSGGRVGFQRMAMSGGRAGIPAPMSRGGGTILLRAVISGHVMVFAVT